MVKARAKHRLTGGKKGDECMGTKLASHAVRLIHIVCPPLTSRPVISRQKWESFDLSFYTNPSDIP